MGYSKEIIKGVSWVAGIRGVTRVLSFLKTVVIARILTPSQFGVFGIATLVLAFIEILTETGINTFLIQEKEDIDKYINTSWIVSICRGVLIALILAISAPFVAVFFHIPSAVHTLLLISIVPIIRGFINPSVVKFQKELKFNKDFIYNTTTFLIESIVTVILVLLTYSVNALIWGMIIGVIYEVGISFVMVSPKPSFEFHKTRFFKVLHYGKWITGATIFNYFYQHGDDIAVGRLLGATSLGYYDMAYRLSLVPLSDISDVITKVTFPVYVRLSDDKKRLQRAFFRSIFFVLLLVVPIGLILFFFPREIITLVFGKKWIPAAPALQVLGIFGIIRAFSAFGTSFFLSIQKQKIFTFITFIGLIGMLVTIIPSVLRYGIVGAAYSALFGTVITIPLVGYFLYRFFYKK